MREANSNVNQPVCGCNCWWRLPVLLAAVLAGIVLVRVSATHETKRINRAANEAPGTPQETNATVSLEIQFGKDRTKKYDSIPWCEGMTIDDLLTAATRLRDGIRYEVLADGAHAMLVSIDEVGDQGGRGRNWTYKVNGVFGDRSFAVYELQPGDRVLWTFGPRP
jgi:Domain of unknown function (DUF4430)